MGLELRGSNLPSSATPAARSLSEKSRVVVQKHRGTWNHAKAAHLSIPRGVVDCGTGDTALDCVNSLHQDSIELLHLLTSIHEHERRIIGFLGTDYRTPNSTTIHCVIACYVPEYVLLVLNVTEASLCRAHAGTTDERKVDKNNSFFKPPRVFNRGWYILARCY